MSKPFVVACVPACDEERSIGGVVVRALKFMDRIVVCDDGSRGRRAMLPRVLGMGMLGAEGSWAMYIFSMLQFG